MMYISTRNNSRPVNGAAAIAYGMAPAGGLFVPESIPVLTTDEIAKMAASSYQELAIWILGKYLPGFRPSELADCVYGAYGAQFDTREIAPVVKLSDREYILELWHGPTAAFKDLALQLLPGLLLKAVEKLNLQKEVLVMAATADDTGKAALEGFQNVAGTRILVFSPVHGVSPAQQLPMMTVGGDNASDNASESAYMVGIDGNFHDCQQAVQNIAADGAFRKRIERAGYHLSSANSTNWGRILPQIVYYFSAYLALVNKRVLAFGQLVDFAVPTGSLGNLLAGWYAKQMGLPIGKLICASNENRVLTDFFLTGTFDARRNLYQTNTPAMDVLHATNLERFLFVMSGNNGAQVAQWMEALKQEGWFRIDPGTKANMDAVLVAGSVGESDTRAAIRTCYDDHHYLIDPHTAVALKVSQEYSRKRGDKRIAVIASTAHPCKFAARVLEAFHEPTDDIHALQLADRLLKRTTVTPHKGLQNLLQKPARYDTVCDKDGVLDVVEQILKL